MFCGICSKGIGLCTCPDIDERMDGLRNDPKFIFKMCRTCGLHYERCKCEEPDWTTSHDGVEMKDVVPDFNEGYLSECKVLGEIPMPRQPQPAKLFPVSKEEEAINFAMRILKDAGVDVIIGEQPLFHQATIHDVMQYQHYIATGGKLQ